MKGKIFISIYNQSAQTSSISKLQNKIINSDCGSSSSDLDYLFDFSEASFRNNTFIFNATGVETFSIHPLGREYYKRRLFESKYSSSVRFFNYINNSKILEKLTDFVLSKSTNDQKDKWERRRESFSITINDGDYPFFIEHLKSHHNSLRSYN